MFFFFCIFIIFFILCLFSVLFGIVVRDVFIDNLSVRYSTCCGIFFLVASFKLCFSIFVFFFSLSKYFVSWYLHSCVLFSNAVLVRRVKNIKEYKFSLRFQSIIKISFSIQINQYIDTIHIYV